MAWTPNGHVYRHRGGNCQIRSVGVEMLDEHRERSEDFPRRCKSTAVGTEN